MKTRIYAAPAVKGLTMIDLVLTDDVSFLSLKAKKQWRVSAQVSSYSFFVSGGNILPTQDDGSWETIIFSMFRDARLLTYSENNQVFLFK